MSRIPPGDPSHAPSRIEVYDPPMCCASGVCGPSVDPTLPRFAADVEWLRSQGARVVRYNLATSPGAFARREIVRAALETKGQGVLPMVVVEGRVVSEGAYPVREALAALLNVPAKG